jgi:RNA polymerase sigma factor (TIGR02999 family)
MDAEPEATDGGAVDAVPAIETTGELFTAVYDRLKAMAAKQLSRLPPGATLETTALVHELYLRLERHPDLRFGHEARFFAYAARAMRHLLADRARHRQRQRAGGEWHRVTLTGSDEALVLQSADDAVALDAALERLAAIDPRAAHVLELRYFAGLDLACVAQALSISRRTVDRDWEFARAFMQAELG